MPQKRWLSTKEASEYTGYSTDRITHFCREGSLKHTRVGRNGAYRFLPEWLDLLLNPEPLSVPDADRSRDDVVVVDEEFARMVGVL